MGAVATQSTAVEQRRQQGATLRAAIENNREQFALALPRHVDSGRFMRAALTAINVVPKLAQCTQHSVLAGLMQAAQLGLEISDVRGQAYLIPRWDRKDGVNRATMQLGYRGMIDLAARAGITVDWDVVHANDAFEFERGTNARLMHRPTLDDPGAPIAYYAVAHFADNRRPQFLLRSRRQVETHRDRFASQRDSNGNISGPWIEHFDAMAAKTVIRMLLDKLPTSAELRQAVAVEEASQPLDVGAIAYTRETGDVFGAIDVAGGDLSPPADVDPDTGEFTEPDPEREAALEAPDGSKPRSKRSTKPSSPPPDDPDAADAAWVADAQGDPTP